MKNISIIGAGTMGNGIAHVFALHGFKVSLIDISKEALNKAFAVIEKNLDRQIKKEIIDDSAKTETLSRISVDQSLKGAADSELVIEAVSEKEDIKVDIFRELDKLTPKECILATNTSSISITKLASYTNRPAKVIGMHFMNPVPVMKLVEIINGYATAPHVTDTIYNISKQIGKTPVSVNDYPGFISNRILMPMINEAIYALHEQVAGVEEVDQVMTLGMAHPMGPLKLADFIGLDVCLNILNVLHKGFGNPKYAPCTLLVNMVTAGFLGTKTGEGFYVWEGTKSKEVSHRFLK